MKRNLIKYCTAVICSVLFCVSAYVPDATGVTGSFLYKLSDFTGPIPYNWSKVFIDKTQKESYVLYQNLIRIFDKNGMEIYRFGEDLNIGAIADGDVEKDGTILLLAYGAYGPNQNYMIHRVNYRGEPISRISLAGLPQEFTGFQPNRLIYYKGELYLLSQASMKVVVTDSEGRFKEGYILADIMQLTEKERDDNMIVGFSVDKSGNMLYTIPTLFRAYIVSRDRKVTSFGQPGGTPGKFGVVAGIVADDRGNYLIVDKLKCQVMIFDQNLKFIQAFGFRGAGPANLIAPDDIGIDSENNIYVTQSRKRGVNVYRLIYE
jgi:hypothetical protein